MPAKRELVKPKGDARYVRRDRQGRFNEVDDVGRSLRQDRARRAKQTPASGQGDRGDRVVATSRGKPPVGSRPRAQKTASGARSRARKTAK